MFESIFDSQTIEMSEDEESWDETARRNAAFIAQARTIAPAAAKSTLTAIAALRQIADLHPEKPERYEGDNHGDSFTNGWECAEHALGNDAIAALTEIASHFENV